MVKEDSNQTQKAAVRVTQFVSIDELTEDILVQYSGKIESNNIRVDKDLPQISANVYPKFIHAAVSQLIENAIEQMPTGGELNVTLIEGDRCWELEVADSIPDPPTNRREAVEIESGTSLPKIATIEEKSKLEMAHRAAIVHGGHIQTWDCPQGGTANVLIIPRRQECRKLA